MYLGLKLPIQALTSEISSVVTFSNALKEQRLQQTDDFLKQPASFPT